MLLNAFLVALTLVAILCLWLQWRKARIIAPYLAATVLFFAAGTSVLAITWINPGYFGAVTLSHAVPEGVYQDTYYVVVQSPSPFLWTIGALLPVGLVWLQMRTRSMYHPAWVQWLFWPHLIGLMIVPVVSARWMTWGMPRSYSDYTAHTSQVLLFYTSGFVIGLLALTTLLALTLLGLFHRFGRGHPPST